MIPLGAAAEAAGVLTDLFLVLLAAKIGDEIFKRLHQPGIVGEVLAGLVVGPSLLGVVEPSEALDIFAELGLVFLLFWVGLETRLSDLQAVGRTAASVGVLGVILPFAGGVALGYAMGEPVETNVLLGAALVATSVGITSAVLVDLGVVRTPASRTILGAAVVDDILAMIILAIGAGMAATGGVDVVSIATVVALALAFVAFFALGGTAFTRRRPQILSEPRFSESPVLPAVLVALGLAAFAAQIGLAAIVGAFLAGMIVAETKEHDPVEHEIAPLYAFFPPFFFASIGVAVDLSAFADATTLLLLGLVTAVAIVTKFAGAWLGARPLGGREAFFVGVGMVPRGEVGLIVAGVAATAGAIGDRMFAVIVGMSIVTTLIVPPVLRRASDPRAAAPS